MVPVNFDLFHSKNSQSITYSTRAEADLIPGNDKMSNAHFWKRYHHGTSENRYIKHDERCVWIFSPFLLSIKIRGRAS